MKRFTMKKIARISCVALFGILSLVCILVMTASLTCIYTESQFGKDLVKNFPWLESKLMATFSMMLSLAFGGIAGDFVDKICNS